MTSTQQPGSKVTWPDMSKDMKAWELAKIALGPHCTTEQLVRKAQEIKEAL